MNRIQGFNMTTRAKKARNMADPPGTQHSAGNIAATLSRQARQSSASDTTPAPSPSVSEKPTSTESDSNTENQSSITTENIDSSMNLTKGSISEKEAGTMPTFQLPAPLNMPPIHPIIPDPETADNTTISKAINSMHALLQESIFRSAHNLSEITNQFQTLETKLDKVQERQVNFESKISHEQSQMNLRIEDHSKRIDSIQEGYVKLEVFDSLKTEFERSMEEMEDRIQCLSDELLNVRLDTIRNTTETEKLEKLEERNDLIN